MFFKPLTKENLTGIIAILTDGLRQRLAEKDLGLRFTDSATALIIDRGYDPVYGARPLKRYLQSAAETLIARDIPAGATLVVDERDGELVCDVEDVAVR